MRKYRRNIYLRLHRFRGMIFFNLLGLSMSARSVVSPFSYQPIFNSDLGGALNAVNNAAKDCYEADLKSNLEISHLVKRTTSNPYLALVKLAQDHYISPNVYDICRPLAARLITNIPAACLVSYLLSEFFGALNQYLEYPPELIWTNLTDLEESKKEIEKSINPQAHSQDTELDADQEALKLCDDLIANFLGQENQKYADIYFSEIRMNTEVSEAEDIDLLPSRVARLRLFTVLTQLENERLELALQKAESIQASGISSLIFVAGVVALITVKLLSTALVMEFSKAPISKRGLLCFAAFYGLNLFAKNIREYTGLDHVMTLREHGKVIGLFDAHIQELDKLYKDHSNDTFSTYFEIAKSSVDGLKEKLQSRTTKLGWLTSPIFTIHSSHPSFWKEFFDPKKEPQLSYIKA